MYQNTIRKILPGVDPRHVEAWMRSEHGTLDHLSPAAFDAAARVAAECIKEGGVDMAERLAESYGIVATTK